MKVYSLTVALLFTSAPLIADAAPDLTEFNLVFEEEFTGAVLDPNVWSTGYLWGPYEPINQEEQLYVDYWDQKVCYSDVIFRYITSL